jgi:hypothetical protein
MSTLHIRFGAAKGRQRPQRGSMNKTEAAYQRHLEVLRASGEVLWFGFEAIKLRLADRTYYTPDFAVLLADLTLEAHEVKGFWEDDARVKIKVAAESFPIMFRAFKPSKGGGWSEEAFAE